ncbi:MAG: ParB/RepB/Spo0J family partition protein [Coprobacillus sp.]|nr:ParB/RepB/Spo0J family partition protein [Coprobacillus sp.]
MNLLNEIGNFVQKTSITRKLTINNETKIYPVYKININALYYNDQNDRIASWISQYKEINGSDALLNKEKEEYNKIIENFIIMSNPQSMEKTALNIKLVGQREPGVVLSDGRVIDGNRRFTCIRKLNKNDASFCWFESVILDVDIHNNKKMIKMLELSIQHGEEKRVDYNHVEKLIGIYQDIVETQLLTVEEYAQSTNESVAEIKKKVECSKILAEYLEYIGMPKQFYIAREFQLVSLISDIQELLKKCINNEMVYNLKKIIFMNQMMNSFGDERKFTKNIATLIANGKYFMYEKSQMEIEEKIKKRMDYENINNFQELRSFVVNNDDLSDELKYSMDKYLNDAKINEVHNKPSQILKRTTISLKEIDKNVITKLTPVEKDRLNNQLYQLTKIVNDISGVVKDEKEELNNNKTSLDISNIDNDLILKDKETDNLFKIIPSSYDEFVYIKNYNIHITSLLFAIEIKLISGITDNNYLLFFIDTNNEVISNKVNIAISDVYQEVKFELMSKANEFKEIYLVIKKQNDKDNEIRFMFKFKCDISFGGDFDF